MAVKTERAATRLDLLAGRAAAWCLHPVAAWRLGSARARALVVFAYAAASYALTLAALLLALK